MMEFDLQAVTEPGKKMVLMAEEHSADFATRADEHDSQGTFAFENVEAMKKSGFAAAAVPQEFGGMGVTSIHDCVVAMNRLGRGDASTPLAFTMHLFRVLSTARGLNNARKTGNQARQARLEDMLRKIGAGDFIISVANSERGADIRTSRTTATKTKGGWLFNGTKTFATGSPAANVLAVRARYQNSAGEERLGATMAPVDRPGVEIMNDWQGMGMRASASHDVVFTDYFVPDEEFDDIGEFGKYNAAFLSVASGASMGLSSIFLGIAEAAQKIAVDATKERGRADYPMNQVTVAENEIELAACRGILGRAAQSFDDFYQTGAGAGGVVPEVTEMEAFEIIKNAATAKKYVMEKAGEIVNRAITVYGGGGFVTGSTLARLYRDVRAGPLMQPWATNQAVEFIGKVSLGINPND